MTKTKTAPKPKPRRPRKPKQPPVLAWQTEILLHLERLNIKATQIRDLIELSRAKGEKAKALRAHIDEGDRLLAQLSAEITGGDHG